MSLGHIDLHYIPAEQKWHKANRQCTCKPKVHKLKGNALNSVHHRPGRGYRGLWRVKFIKVSPRKGGSR